MTEQRYFKSPAQDLVFGNTTEGNSNKTVMGVSFPADICNFCGEPVRISYDTQNGFRSDYDFDALVKNLCCDKMKAIAETMRKDHEKEIVEHFIYFADKETPPIYKKFRLGDFPTSKTATIRKYFKEKEYESGRGFYIYSRKNGTGKTALSCTIAKTLCGVKRKIWYSFINYPDFVNKYEQASFDDKSFILERCREAYVLVIDDLGKGRSTNQSITNIYDIVNYRNINQMITIVNSNISLQEISEKFDSSVSSRLYEMCDIMEMEGEDLRMATAKQEVSR
jgi:DNA replication protein DnaC